MRGTASRLDWLRLKATRAGAAALYALLAEIHRLGLLAGTDAGVRWHLVRQAARTGTVAPPAPTPRCHATFLFWRGLQLRHLARANGRAAWHSHETDGG